MLDLQCLGRIWRISEKLEKSERRKNGLEWKRRESGGGAVPQAAAMTDIGAVNGTGNVILTTFAGEMTGMQPNRVQKDPDLDPILQRTSTDQIVIAPRTMTVKKSPDTTGKAQSCISFNSRIDNQVLKNSISI